jgi:hypothetical protein
MRRRISLLVAISVIVGVTGCSARLAHFTPYTEMAFAQSEAVAVLHFMPRDQAYVELGEISILVRSWNRETYVMELRHKARAIGANAIVLLGDRTTEALVSRGRVTPMREVVAIAIRYTS